MRNLNYEEGAYYYTYLVFKWGPAAIYPDPSIYAIREKTHIWLPPLKTFLSKNNCKSMYIPFFENDLEIKI